MVKERIMKGTSLRYWKIYRISLNSQCGYEYHQIPTAQEFVFSSMNSLCEDTQAALLSIFNATNSAVDNMTRAYAGLCLRCYVSEPILKACKKIDHLFGGEKSFTYQDFLGFALNDDGQSLVILDSAAKMQFILNRNGQEHKSTYQLFTVKVLQTFKSDSATRMSLDNWTYLQTKQNPEIKEFLSEHGFKNLSDWALLNRTRPKQLERLSERDRHLIEVFHAVYRRDRLQQRQIKGKVGSKRCPDPSNTQLTEMLAMLNQQGITINTSDELTKALKYAAIQLRQYDLWSYREPLEIQDPETGNYTPRTDLAHESISENDIEEREFLEFLHEQLQLTLIQVIQEEIRSCISRLEKSKKYAPFAKKLIPGLQMYYGQGMSLKDIAPLLEMTSWDQARRILNPGELLTKVREQTVQKLLDRILKKVQEKGLITINPSIEYLKNLVEQIELFADQEVFQSAADEIRSGKSRAMNSAYAQQLRLILSHICQHV
jgi:hypothetical protein